MAETWTDISLVGPHAGMFDAWFALYERYAAQRGAAPDRRTAGILWRWLLDGTYRVAGVLALDNRKEMVGFAHFRPYPNTLDGTEACRIDDIYVTAAQSDTNLAERLVEHVVKTARKRGWTEITWEAHGEPGFRSVYDRLAVRSDVATYRITVTPPG